MTFFTKELTFAETLFYSFVVVCCLLVVLYLATIVWLGITHFLSISKFLTQYTFVMVKESIQRLFGVKEKIQCTLEELELSDLEIPLNSTTKKKTALQTSIPQKSVQAKKLKSSKTERG